MIDIRELIFFLQGTLNFHSIINFKLQQLQNQLDM